MGKEGWHVLTAIYGFLEIVGIILLYVNRKHPYVKHRNWKFLLFQNSGALTSATILTLYFGLRPAFSCYLYYIASLLIYSGFILPLAVRYWEYCVNFHISKVRTKFRSNVLLPNWGENSWFFRNRWVSSPKFLNTFFSILFVILLIPTIPYFFLRDDDEYNQKTGGCQVYAAGVYLVPVIALICFVLFAVLAYLMKNSRDAYHIKTEMYALTITWVTVLVIWIPYSQLSITFLKTLSPSFWMVMGLYSSSVWICFFPLILVYRHPVILLPIGGAEGGPNGEFNDFVEKLENLRFRNALHDFLKLQFCQENILFYEVVTDWRRLPMSDSDRTATAKSIHDNYVLESGLCQVNLPGSLRQQVSRDINKDPVPPEIFDASLKEVLEMIYANSFLPFKASTYFVNNA